MPVLPSLEYSSSVWDPHTSVKINQLEEGSKRDACFVNKTFSRKVILTHILNWTPLGERRARAKATLFYKVLHKLVDLPTGQLAMTNDFIQLS